MKIFKKALCLVLAMVMAIGTLAISASADDSTSTEDKTATAVAYEDLTDTDEITDEYALSVKILVALEVINGYKEDNTFKPQGTLSRQEAAKIVCAVAEGADNLKLYNDSTVKTGFKDVDSMSNRWAAGYISYGVAEGIIAGKGDNNFDPTGTLTGYEFEKMLLCALGYDAEIEGLVGSNWKTRTTTVANIAKLLDDLRNYNPSAAITREQAAQLAFNALFAEKVSYATSGISTNLREYTGEWLINKVHKAITATDWAYLTTSGDVRQGIGNIKTIVMTDLADSSDTDNFGVPTGNMTLAGIEIKKEAIPVYSWTNGSSVKFATTMKSKYGTLSNVNVIENGNEVKVLNVNTDSALGSVQTSAFVLGAYDANEAAWKTSYTAWDKLVAYVTYAADCAGTYVEVYEVGSETEDYTLYVIVKTATFAKVNTAVTAATGSDELASISVSDLSDKTTNISGTTRKTIVYSDDDLYEDLKQNLGAYVGAYIRTTVDEYGEVVYKLLGVDYLTAITGSPSYYLPNTNTFTKSIGTLKFENVTYSAAKEGDMSNIAGKSASDVAALAGSTLYIDANGVAYGIVSKTTTTSTNYAYVTNISSTETTFGSNVYAAQIVKAQAGATPEVISVKVPSNVTNVTATYVNKLVTYTVASDGTYSLTTKDTTFVGNDSVVGTGTKGLNITTNGKTAVATLGSASTANYADNSTVFIVINGSFMAGQKTGITSSTVYQGVSNVPTLLKVGDGDVASSNMYVAYLADTTTTSRLNVAVIINSKNDTGMAGVYFISVPGTGSALTTDLTGSYYTYTAVVDNELTTIKVDSSSTAYATLQANGTGFYKVESTNTDGLVLTFSNATDQIMGQFKNFGGGVLSTVETVTDDNNNTAREDVNYVCAADVPVFIEKSAKNTSGAYVSSGKIATDTASNLNSNATYVMTWANDTNGTASQSTGKTIYYFVDTNGSVVSVFIAFDSAQTDSVSTNYTGSYYVTIDSDVADVAMKLGDADLASGSEVYQGKKVTLIAAEQSDGKVPATITITYTNSWDQLVYTVLTLTEGTDVSGNTVYSTSFTMPAYDVTVTSVSYEA